MKNIFYSLVVILITALFIQASQIVATQLHVTVRNELGNIETGAAVRLFETEDDYRKESNQVGETQYTDKKGIAKFKNLKNISYFILVENEDRNNYGGGVATDKLLEGKINKVTIIIE
jgi:hypothetical protein